MKMTSRSCAFIHFAHVGVYVPLRGSSSPAQSLGRANWSVAYLSQMSAAVFGMICAIPAAPLGLIRARLAQAPVVELKHPRDSQAEIAATKAGSIFAAAPASLKFC